MTIISLLGYTVSYTTINMERCAATNSKQVKHHIDKFVNNLLVKFSWSNLYARLVVNTVRLDGKSLYWHSKILIASRMPTAPPILTGEKFKRIKLEEFSTPESLIRKCATGRTKIKSFNVMVLSLIAVFQHSLLSAEHV